MRLDDLAQRAAEEIRAASAQAQFTVRQPGGGRWLTPRVAFAAAGVMLAIGLPLLLLYGPWLNPITGVPVATTTTTTQATTTEESTTTSSPTTTTTRPSTVVPSPTPAATVEELVAATYAAVNARDNDALWALHTSGAGHQMYFVEGRMGRFTQNFRPGDDVASLMASDGLSSIELLGPSLVSGDVVATPVAYNYADGVVLTGFDLAVVAHVQGGLLVGGAATFLATEASGLADPAVAQALWDTGAAAFNAGDVEGVLGTFDPFAVLWPYITSPADTYRGAVRIRGLLTSSLFFTVEATGEPVASGPFAMVPSRRTVTATGDAFEGVYVFWISDGKIRLQAYAQAPASVP